MSLKRDYATADEIPEALKALYVEKDGKFVLDLEATGDDAPLKGALEKERKARAATEKALRELQAKLGDLDPVKAREALKMIQDLEDKALVGDLPAGVMAKVEELVQKRVERMAADHKKTTEALEGQNKTLSTRLEEVLIVDSLRAAAIKAGIRPSAVDDVVLFGKTVWKLRDGEPTPFKPDGEVLYGKEPNKPMTREEWIAERAADRPHWFEPSGGAGTQPGAGTRSAGNIVTITAEQAKDTNAYRTARAAAEKAGQQLQVVQ